MLENQSRIYTLATLTFNFDVYRGDWAGANPSQGVSFHREMLLGVVNRNLEYREKIVNYYRTIG